MNWCGVSAKKSFCIYQSAIWLGRNRILVFLWTIKKSKVTATRELILQLDSSSNQTFVILQNTFSHLLRLEQRLFRNSFLPFNRLNPKSDQYQISPCNSDALKTELWWELRTWSHKMYLLDILSTSPHNFYSKWIGTTKENFKVIPYFALRTLYCA